MINPEAMFRSGKSLVNYYNIGLRWSEHSKISTHYKHLESGFYSTITGKGGEDLSCSSSYSIICLGACSSVVESDYCFEGWYDPPGSLSHPGDQPIRF